MASGALRVLPDANIWFSRTLRDWLVLIQLERDRPPYDIFWTEDILAEMVAALREKYPFHDEQQVGGIRRRIVDTYPGGAITDYRINPILNYRDPKDAHIHAAAVQHRIDVVISNNVRDLRRHGDTASEFAVLTADEFLTLVDDTSPSLVQAVTNRQRRYWADRRPTVTLTAALVSAGAPEFAKRVERHLESNA